MFGRTLNDNDITRADGRLPDPDAHGQAAMLLVESLIHGLIARSVLSVEEAVEIVDVATEVSAEMADDPEGSPVALRKSLTMLKSIGSSLSHDLDGL